MMRRLLYGTFCLLFLGWGCKSTSNKADAGLLPAEEAQIKAALLATTADWNQGNLEGFMALYDRATTFMTPKGLIGLAQLKERYERSYFAGKQPKQQLSFSELSLKPLGQDYALVTGKYSLTGGAAPAQSGRFSLVFHRTDKGWKILHDHSS